MTKEFKRKQYTNVEAFVYGTDKPPKWFMELIEQGKIKVSLEHKSLSESIVKLEFETKNGT